MSDGPIHQRPTVFGVKEINSSKDVPWYIKSISPQLMSPALVDLLENYAGVPPEEQDKHLHEVEIFPMPCIGLWWWLALGMTTHPRYPEVLHLLKSHHSSSPRSLLDLGSCVGQDLRKLIHDGVPVDCICGCDLLAEWEGVGQALFRDAHEMQGRFIQGDIFSVDPDAALFRTRGDWDVVNINMFLHGFTWDDQVAACRAILRLLKPRPGSLVLGIQNAGTKEGTVRLGPPFLAPGEEREVFVHDMRSFARMWEEVGRGEGVELKISAGYQDKLDLGKVVDEKGYAEKAASGFSPKTQGEQRRMFFSIERV